MDRSLKGLFLPLLAVLLSISLFISPISSAPTDIARATFKRAASNGLNTLQPRRVDEGTPSGNTIPGAPADPPQPAEGDGSGAYDSESPGLGDRALEVKYRTIAAGAAARGFSDASRHMTHYLDGSGDDLDVSPERMLRDMANFRAAAKAFAQAEGASAYASAVATAKSSTASAPFTSSWKVYDYGEGQFTDNWYYAMGAFSYSVTGVVTVSIAGGKATASLKYKTHVFDRYNWDKGKKVDIGPFEFKDDELQKLHRTGLAQEYVIRGHSETQTVDGYTPTGSLPEPGTAGSRDGGRSDPGRDRGR
ncbi:MAG: hypothetical protein M1833_003152 [Piccolia ochrophora]|nr:MAG: hypothetical protein M1833_003152 [Piccolia ochrophora]